MLELQERKLWVNSSLKGFATPGRASLESNLAIPGALTFDGWIDI